MVLPLANLIDTLTSNPDMSVSDAGRVMLDVLSEKTVSAEEFQGNPRVLLGSEHQVSRYLAQVVWRALSENYETLEEVVEALHGMLDRNPPTLEASGKRPQTDETVVVPEARVLGVRAPVRLDGGGWEARFEAEVTSGGMRHEEIEVRVDSTVNPTACFSIPYFWVHARIAAYNLVPEGGGRFAAGPDTFFVLEPLLQVNATTIARSLACPKPEIDHIRKGRDRGTIHTLKGILVHAILDRILEGEDDAEACYRDALSGLLVNLAAIAEGDFNEEEFGTEVLRHAEALKEFIDVNPHMRRDPQVELRRYSATLGIQGRIDAVFQSGNRLDIVELKTGRRIRPEDHAQLFIYRLLLSDYVRHARSRKDDPIELTARLLCSHDATVTPLKADVEFLQVLQARNRLVGHSHGLARAAPHVALPYADYDPNVCGACPSWTRSRCQQDSRVFGDLPDSADTPERIYYREFTQRVQRESARAAQELADLLDDSRMARRILSSRTITDARCEGMDSGVFVFKFEENASDLTRGDRVLIHSGAISRTASYHGYLQSVDASHAEVRISVGNLSTTTFESRPWMIDRFPSDPTSVASQTALYDFLTAPMSPVRQVLLGQLHAESASPDSDMVDAGRQAGAAGSGEPVGRTVLNPSQAEAVQRAGACSTFHLIWGPPGTGKTRVIPEIVRRVSGSVLLGAFTNTALDKMLIAVLDLYPETQFIRMGRSKDSPDLAERLGARRAEYFSEDLATSLGSPGATRRRMDQISVFAATAHGAASHPYLRGRRFEMALVDEAGQLTEPLTLGLIMRARRFVLIGDDRQLPPVVRAPGLERSLFERLKEQAGREKPESLSLLDVQYRMHPDIMNVSNTLFYGGVLSAGVEAGDREPPIGPPLVFIPVDYAAEGRSNPAEAHAIDALVRSLCRHTRAEGIGVISPFRAQVVLLRQLLDGTGVTVDTVERFQGGEREVIVISFVRSHDSRFVFDDRRLNVAMTRARRKLIFVAHPDLFRNTKYEWMCNFVEPTESGVAN